MKQIYSVPNVVINDIMLVLPTKFKSIKTLNSGGHGHNIYMPIYYIYIFQLKTIQLAYHLTGLTVYNSNGIYQHDKKYVPIIASITNMYYSFTAGEKAIIY